MHSSNPGPKQVMEEETAQHKKKEREEKKQKREDEKKKKEGRRESQKLSVASVPLKTTAPQGLCD